MAKIKVHEIAKEFDIKSSDVISALADLGIEGKTASSGLEDDQAEAVRKKLSGKAAPAPAKPAPAAKTPAKPAAEKPAPKAEAGSPAARPAQAPGTKPPVRPAGAPGAVPVKKKKPIIVVSSARNNQPGGRGTVPGRGAAPVRPGQRTGIIRPTVPTTAERAAREAETLQGGDKDRLRKAGTAPKKENPEVVKTDVSPAGSYSGAAGSAPGSTGSQKPAQPARPARPAGERPAGARPAGGRPAGARPAGDKPAGDKPARPERRGGIVINQGRSFNASGEPPKDNNRPGGAGRKGNTSKDKNKKDKIFENEDGFRGGKQIKGKGTKMPVRPAEKKAEPEEEKIKVITLPETITIKELSDKMKIQSSQIIKKLFLQGKVVTVNEEISYEEAEEIAVEYDILCEKEVVVDVIEELLREEEEDPSTMTSRPPVICVMGHVDHGKTSLLDAIRNTKVIEGEAGGITQAIGAYVVNVNGRKITFLDTPGHEAFTAMRMRGANATDIAILVVAADDGVMPQTIEAINHAKAAGIEIIVAVNKIDKPSANIDRVKQELSEYELVPEDWGGSTVFAPVSAKTGEGIKELLEMILLTSDILELKANANRRARGMVIEAQLDKGRGPVATVLVQKGTLHVGDFIAAGASHGKVRAMIDDSGRRVKEAGPSTPVEILGLNDVPGAGEVFVSLDSDKEAKNFAETFIAQNKVKLLDDTKMKTKMSLEGLFSKIQEGNLKELNLILKADVQGSVEAVKESLLKLSNEEVVVKVIHSGVGAINESDVILASASNAIIIGFNVRPDATAKATAETEGVDVRLYDVIYKAIEDVEDAMKGMLDPIFEEKVIGHAEIRQIFKASGIGNIAGSYMLDGVMQRGCLIRIRRGEEQIYEGKLASLKRFKDDVKEVKAGFECGLVFEDFGDFAELDVVEGYVMVEVPR
ncbi:MAG: translation initiation factor IF-2 [Lachnospiraceae bacterium]|nr:translation initiation factor IF-2 [Lachnospiraceae bacterium]